MDKPADSGYQEPSYGYEAPSMNAFQEAQPSEESQVSREAPTSGYEPPSYQPYGYEPPSYNPEPETPKEDEDAPRPKKSFMDDDEDNIPTLKPAEKTQEDKDRENAEMFRKAAEEDGMYMMLPCCQILTNVDTAKRAEEEKAAKTKKGWGLTSWWGAAKTDTLENQPNKPVRANLGEKSSFVFDPELKRWVNKNGGSEDNAAKKATPPPPRSAPRSAAATPPPAGRASAPPPSLLRGSLAPSASVPNLAAAAAMQDRLAAPPTMTRTASSTSADSSGGGPPPPSRPPTSMSMSNASSIDDLLSSAGPRKPGAKKGRKSGRYVDVMAK